MNRRIVVVVLLCVVAIALGAEESATLTREQRELKMAEESIIASLAVSRSPKGRYLCAENRVACLGADKAELGLALIGARSTRTSLAALAGAMRYRADASLSEDYACYVLQKGKLIEDYLLQAKPALLEKQCESELEHVVAVDKLWFEGMQPNAVCADEQTIKATAESLRKAIRAGRKCAPGDF